MREETKLAVFFFVIVIAIAVVLSIVFGDGKKCSNFECFGNIMQKCNFGTYVNEEAEASWQYKINGLDKDNNCIIEVKLLQAKEGELALREAQGHEMLCSYPLGVVAYPDKDLSVCHGRLKEDLQEILIRNLHEYIVGNVGDIKEVLNS